MGGAITRIDLFLSRTRAVAAPLYQEFPPPPDLREFVACTWVRLVHGLEEQISADILPDGCADIMAYDDYPPRVAGPDAVTRRIKLSAGIAITGIRLRPGACRAVLGCPASAIVNGSVLLSDLASDAVQLHQRLMLAHTLKARLSVLEDWVRAALDRVTDKDRAVIQACRMLGADPRIAIDEVARRLDWNARTIHRQFLAACGYSPKHFQRIMRIQSVLQAANGAPSRRLSELAAAAGYADQAHMTRDFRDITGFTPAAYFANTADRGWGEWISEGW
ncbi:MAG TPA: helix-turn-helix domain-containing protein [Hyphomonadaceae bacterium]|jgi:AraC-like DNA-binding protein|nr:helix-turn-helix domain-containing protein [Hyphomonadaceae bacterium]